MTHLSAVLLRREHLLDGLRQRRTKELWIELGQYHSRSLLGTQSPEDSCLNGEPLIDSQILWYDQCFLFPWM